MKESKKALLEKQGWKVGTVEQFLGLTPEESEYIELKLLLSRAVRERREQYQMTQTAFAKRLGSSQSRVAKMEKGDPSVSLDLLVKSLFTLNATRHDLAKWLVG